MWKFTQCAVQGRSHIKNDIPCQDKTFTLTKNNVNVSALADGAGSAKLSHLGAEYITKFICEDLANNFDDYFLEADGRVIKQKLTAKMICTLNELSKRLECHIKDLASTLLLVAVKEDQFIIAHIGDGVIGYLKNNELKVASEPNNGEFVNTTIFTTSIEAMITMKLLKGNLGDIQGFILMSDGTEQSLYDKQKNKIADVLKEIMNKSIITETLAMENQLHNSFEATVKQLTTDDCSLVLMINDKDEFPGYLNLSDEEKRELLKENLEVNSLKNRRKLRHYDTILYYYSTNYRLNQRRKYKSLQPRYRKWYIKRLLELNLIEKVNGSYRTIVIMNHI